jgi:hypothetical protein
MIEEEIHVYGQHRYTLHKIVGGYVAEIRAAGRHYVGFSSESKILAIADAFGAMTGYRNIGLVPQSKTAGAVSSRVSSREDWSFGM